MESKDLPKRKPKGYFITICTENRGKILSTIVGEGLAPPEIQLTRYGKIVEEQLLLLKNRYSNLEIDIYAIMPNHIHIIFVLLENTGGASPSPTILEIRRILYRIRKPELVLGFLHFQHSDKKITHKTI